MRLARQSAMGPRCGLPAIPHRLLAGRDEPLDDRVTAVDAHRVWSVLVERPSVGVDGGEVAGLGVEVYGEEQYSIASVTDRRRLMAGKRTVCGTRSCSAERSLGTCL